MNIAFTVATVLSILSVLVVVLSYKIVSNNKELGTWKNKLAKRELELENEPILEQEAKETANNQMEELKNQLQQEDKELIDVKQQLGYKHKNVSKLTTEKEKLEVELKSQEGIQRLSTELKNRVDFNQKKELNHQDSKTLEFKEKLCSKDTTILNLREKILKLEKERDYIKTKLSDSMEKFSYAQNNYERLEYLMRKIQEEDQASREEYYVKPLKEKIQDQVKELLKKQKVIEEMNNKIEELKEKVNLLDQKNKNLYDKTVTHSNEKQKLIGFMHKIMSDIGEQIKDLALFLDKEEEEGGCINSETVKYFLDNLKSFYSSTINSVEVLSIPVEQKDELTQQPSPIR
ncbi:hypothetical protein [Wolbachia endosymbiont (group A) of Colletes cunicularius]|uniref:hypothetical protein n=1 Tax=Wolbachia endosymbiont (group A) of Colletes cunicularius TaxID=3139321 RepID=UPI0035C8DC8E